MLLRRAGSNHVLAALIDPTGDLTADQRTVAVLATTDGSVFIGGAPPLTDDVGGNLDLDAEALVRAATPC